MSYTMISATFANAENTAAVVMTQESAAVIISRDDTPERWHDLMASGMIIMPFVPRAEPVPKPTRRQLRLWLVRNGHSLAAVDAAIDAMPEPDRSEAMIEWQDASEYDINHPTVQDIGAALGITDLAQAAREAAFL